MSNIIIHLSGGYSEGDTPVPIPNTEVKPFCADDTSGATPWESKSLPGYLSKGQAFGLPLNSSKRMHNYRKFKDYHIERLRKPENAKIYFSVACDDYKKNKDIGAFLLAIGDVAEARGINFDDFLKEVGIFDEVTALAQKELSAEGSFESDRNSEELKGQTKPIIRFFRWL